MNLLDKSWICKKYNLDIKTTFRYKNLNLYIKNGVCILHGMRYISSIYTQKKCPEKFQKLKFLRKDLETQSRTHIRNHGGIDDIGNFVEVILRKNQDSVIRGLLML